MANIRPETESDDRGRGSYVRHLHHLSMVHTMYTMEKICMGWFRRQPGVRALIAVRVVLASVTFDYHTCSKVARLVGALLEHGDARLEPSSRVFKVEDCMFTIYSV